MTEQPAVAAQAYECFDCGTIIVSGKCPHCALDAASPELK
jgi:rubrerythrin